VSREIVGRYERNDAVPSIEIAKRMADVFEVSLDYLVGSTEQEVDKATLNRLQEINRLSDENKKLVYAFLDSFITKTKLQGVLL
jgi:transcriptional regulator with XRE-family HTH domain